MIKQLKARLVLRKITAEKMYEMSIEDKNDSQVRFSGAYMACLEDVLELIEQLEKEKKDE